MKLKSIISCAVSVALMLNMCACSGGTKEETSAAESTGTDIPVEKCITLTESYTFDTGFYPLITPETCQNFGITYWTHNFYQTLVKYENGEMVGDVAESWAMSEDGKTYTFTLKNGLKFSDGTVLDAQAVKTSFDAIIVNLGAYNGSYGRATALFDKVEVVDARTVTITLIQPYYAFLNDITMCNALGIVNPKAFNDDLTYKADEVKVKTFGSGAYMYEGDFSESTYTFVRNPYYSGTKPDADSFKIKVIADNDSKVLALRSGEIDMIVGGARLGMDAYTELKSDTAYGTKISDKSTLTRLVSFNLSEGVFTDDNVREAVSYAIDKNAICTNVMQGVDTAANSYFDKSKPNCAVEVVSYEYNVEKAKEILETAGWIDNDGDGVREKDGSTLDIVMKYSTGYGSIADYVLAVSSQLKEIGFGVTEVDEEIMTYYNSMVTYDFDVMISQTYGGAFDPSTMLTNMNPEVSQDPISMLYANYFEGNGALIAELDSTSDPDRVLEIYRQVLTTIADKSLCVPISYQHEISAWNGEKINGYVFDDDSLYITVANIDVK